MQTHDPRRGRALEIVVAQNAVFKVVRREDQVIQRFEPLLAVPAARRTRERGYQERRLLVAGGGALHTGWAILL